MAGDDSPWAVDSRDRHQYRHANEVLREAILAFLSQELPGDTRDILSQQTKETDSDDSESD